jgi:hypothetical protein
LGSFNLLITGAGGLAQIVMSLWALSDGWDIESRRNELALEEFTALRKKVEHFRLSGNADSDYQNLRGLEVESSKGVSYDNEIGAGEAERKAGWDTLLHGSAGWTQ